MTVARSIRVRGVVQGVGFRPFVYRLACTHRLTGWVLNGEQGVEIHVEGSEPDLDTFLHDLKTRPPPAASIAEVEVHPASAAGLTEFAIRESEKRERPTVRVSPDLPGLRIVSDRTLRPAGSSVPLPLHQLHQLWSALHGSSWSPL